MLNVDRSVSSAPNIICRIIDIDYHHNLHELACQAGVLSVIFARNRFEKPDSDHIGIEVRMDISVSV